MEKNKYGKEMRIKEYITRNLSFARGAFGPVYRSLGIIDHIEEELEEIQNQENNLKDEIEYFNQKIRESNIDVYHVQELREEKSDLIEEWCDVIILAMNGASSAAIEYGLAKNLSEAGVIVEDLMIAKLEKNEMRHWPNWREMEPDKKINHDRSKD